MRAEAVLFMQLISYVRISAATSVSNLKQGESLHRTSHPLFYFISRLSEREARKFAHFLSLLIRRVGPLSFFSRHLSCVFMCARHSADPCKHVASKWPRVFARDGAVCARVCTAHRMCTLHRVCFGLY